MSLKHEDEVKTGDVKPLDYVNELVKDEDITPTDASSWSKNEEKKRLDMKQSSKSKATPGNEDPLKAMLEDERNGDPKSEDIKPVDFPGVKQEDIKLRNASCDLLVKVSEEDKKLIDMKVSIKHEASYKTEERAKAELEDGDKVSIFCATAETDCDKMVVDTTREALCEGENEPNIENIAKDSNFAMEYDNIDVMSKDDVLPEEESVELPTSIDSSLDGAPHLQDSIGLLKCEGEKKPKMESVTQGSGVEIMGQANTDVLSEPDAVSHEEPREPSASLSEKLDSILPSQGVTEVALEPGYHEQPEVIIIKDEPQEVDAPNFLSSDDGRKRRRLIVEVFIDTRANIQRRKEDYEKIRKMTNPKAQKVEKMDFNIESVYDRLKPIGLDPYEITLDQSLRDLVVSRAFMSSRYGGNMQETFPNIGEKHLAKHGMNDFMYLNTMYQPKAPQIPGHPGLFLDTEVDSRWPKIYRVMTRWKPNQWQYEGAYEVKPSPPLSKEEWTLLAPEVRRTWAYQIRKKSWGHKFCARVIARRELGRKPTRAEWMEVYNSGRHTNATPDDIARALDKGEEKLAVSTMKCVGYDESFQRELCEKWPLWVPPPPPVRRKGGKKGTGKPTKAKSKLQAPPVITGLKRKRADSVESELTAQPEDEEEDEEEEEEPTNNQENFVNILDDDEEADELTYRPRGTRSRPICL